MASHYRPIARISCPRATGVVGVKPTYGRVSRYGAIAFASSLDQIGPLARTAEDAALLLAAIAGQDPLDATSLPTPAPEYPLARAGEVASLGGLRIGVPAEYLGDGVSPAVAAAVQAALATFEADGATVVPVSLPHTASAIAVYYLIATAEASSNLARYDGLRYGHRAAGSADLADHYARSRAEGFGPEVRRRIMLGAFSLSSGYYDAYYERAQHEARGHGGGRAARRSAGHARQIPGVLARHEGRALARAAHRELVLVRLGDDDGARLA